jgi:hypothetical protein
LVRTPIYPLDSYLEIANTPYKPSNSCFNSSIRNILGGERHETAKRAFGLTEMKFKTEIVERSAPKQLGKLFFNNVAFDSTPLLLKGVHVRNQPFDSSLSIYGDSGSKLRRDFIQYSEAIDKSHK